MFMLGVIATALAILFLLSAMALWTSNQLRHPAGVMAGLGALLVLGLALLLE
jgi:hypothetical protein